jgi:hypothetical protein
MFFQRKKKSRVEQARENFGKQIRVVNKQATTTRKELGRRLNRTAKDLRSNWTHLISREDQQRAHNAAAELERIAQGLEVRAEKSMEQVEETAKQNIVLTVLVVFALGILAGIFVKEVLD